MILITNPPFLTDSMKIEYKDYIKPINRDGFKVQLNIRGLNHHPGPPSTNPSREYLPNHRRSSITLSKGGILTHNFTRTVEGGAERRDTEIRGKEERQERQRERERGRMGRGKREKECDREREDVFFVIRRRWRMS